MNIFQNIEMGTDAVTQTWGFLGHKGSGKTYAASKTVETFLEHGCQTIILDPVGIWYGLRLLDNGKPSKFEIPILGGLRGDIDLQHSAGKTVADFSADTGSSAILDVSLFRKNQRKVFVADFMEQIFLRHKKVPRPIHLVLEEAQVFCPQRCQPGEQQMLGAIEDIVKIGRNCGIGISLISQRAQSVNKEVLNQCEPLLVFRTIGKHDRTAIEEWAEHADMNAVQSLKQLPSLQPGDCYFWSPSWLQKFVKTRALPKQTSDVSSTPKLGETYVERKLKPVDLVALKGAMSEVAEKQSAEKKKPKGETGSTSALDTDVDIESKKQLAVAHTRITSLEVKNKDLRTAFTDYKCSIKSMIDELLIKIDELHIAAGGKPGCAQPLATHSTEVATEPKVALPIQSTNAQKAPSSIDRNTLKRGEVKVLRSLFWLRNEEALAYKVAYYSGYTVSGNFNNIMSALRRKGCVEGWLITAEGVDVLHQCHGQVEDKPTGEQLVHWMCSRLNTEKKLLTTLYSQAGERISVEQLAELSGYRVSGHFNNMLSRLRSLGAVEGGSREGGVKIADVFLEVE